MTQDIHDPVIAGSGIAGLSAAASAARAEHGGVARGASGLERIDRFSGSYTGTIRHIFATFTTTIVRGAVGSALLIGGTGIATAQHGGGHSGGMGGGMGGFGWWPFLWSLTLLSVLIVGYGIYTRGRTPATEPTQTDTALSTLRARYARGELSEAEFEERRRRLEE